MQKYLEATEIVDYDNEQLAFELGEHEFDLEGVLTEPL
jgi:hypothetical protein